MRLITAENKSTYAAHQSRPTSGEKRQEPSANPRDLAAPFRELFSNTWRQIEEFFSFFLEVRDKGQRMGVKGRGEEGWERQGQIENENE